MFKSSPGRRFGGRGRGATVTVIEDRVHRSSARNAKLAFILTTVVVGVLAATVASSYMHPILGLLLGAVLGAALGALVGAVVLIWPMLRVIWWWATEILLAIGIVYGWVALAGTYLLVHMTVVTVLAGVLTCVGPARRRLLAVTWCVIVRHRLRVCFNQFIIANRSGSLPLILWAMPTPVGERVWIYLRPGLSKTDLEARLDKIVVTCWADAVTVERASTTNAAYLRVDVKRRQVLTGNVSSPLVDMVDPDDLGIPRTRKPAATATVGGLDLPDVPADTTSAPRPSPRPQPATKPAPAAATTVASADGEDVSDWI